MKPILKILPPPQKILWPRLKTIPKQFVLYGGTAIALQLGHRQSIDFDFFSAAPLNKTFLLAQVPFLQQADCVLPEINTLDCYLKNSKGSIKIQFLAGLEKRQGRVDVSLVCEDNQLQVASLRDLLATKLNTIQGRAEAKDYLDIHAIIQSGISLETGLACARAIFGIHFDPSTSLRALCSYREGDLPEISKKIQKQLIKAATSIEKIPPMKAISQTI
ncbi:MAG: nucleotidyl transferase AbiEii/AbiGii toxin family protein [Gammaproteobacteria bacterium]|nr:nucleotidyl transferase AbiEii/AbiGii toxin family protein [Gammaproteobacteria bacterium]